METDQEIIQAAQERLLKKREEHGIQSTETESHSLLTASSPNEFLPAWLRGRKCHHGNQLGSCEECIQTEQEERASRDAAERERAERGIADRKAADLKERIENPEKWLKEYGIPKKFMSCSFENFTGSEKVKEILRTFPEQSILMSGPTGCGKTHLAVATLRSLVQRNSIPDSGLWGVKDVVFTTAPELLLAIRSSFSRNDDEAELVAKYSKPSVLILDDLGADKATEWAITTLYLIIDKRDKELLPTIVTTNLSLGQIEGQYGARIASRLSGMKVITIQLPDYRKRRRS